MGKQPVDLKHVLDDYISEQSIFTEKDRRDIRVKIKEAKFQKKRPVKFLPLLATSAAGFIFLLLTIPFIGDKISTFQSKGELEGQEIQEPARGSIQPKIITEDIIIDRATVKEGDQFGDLLVERVQDSDKSDPKYVWIGFKGEMTLQGNLSVIQVNGVDRVAFAANETSIGKIPKVSGIQREPHILLHSPKEDLIPFLQLENGVKRMAQIKIDHYRIYKDPEDLQGSYDYARLLEVNGEKLPDEIQNIEVTKKYQLLSEAIIPVYEKLVTAREDHALKGLQPLDVFKLYWQAFEFGNLEIKYFLLEGIELPSFENFKAEVIEKSYEYERIQFEKIKKIGISNLEVTVEENRASIQIDHQTDERFELIKNGNGVWKVMFLPQKH
jgi:hypothetical protein